MSPLPAVVIPFRDRGVDPLRVANLNAVYRHWAEDHQTLPFVVSDGRTADSQFNRSAAYNRGVLREGVASVFIFAESDMLISPEQINKAVRLAIEEPGLVVPFDRYFYLSPEASEETRVSRDPSVYTPEFVRDHGRSTGAINVVSRATLTLVGGYDEGFEGNWYDDDAMRIAFELCAGPTRWVGGPAYHLYHLPGWKGDHLSAEDVAATERNKKRLELYQQCQTRADIRAMREGTP